MGVQLNIKDEETVKLARALADKLGKSVTTTIKDALTAEMARLAHEREAKIEAIMQISADFRKNMPADWHGKTSKEIMDEIYDEDGLPI